MGDSVEWVAVDRRKLTRSPLVNAIWQLKFTSEVRLGDGRAVMAFQSALRHNTSLAPAQAQGVAFQVSMGQQVAATPPGVTEQAWRLTSSDGQTVVTAAPGVVTLETNDYGSWEDNFLPWIEDIVAALAETLTPGLTTRIGLRYVNVIFGQVLDRPAFGKLEDFARYIHPALLGFGLEKSGPDVSMIQGRQVLSAGDSMVNLNHALVQAESAEVGMLVDVDAYTEETMAFEAGVVAESTDRLHDTALSVFQQCTTPQAWEAMEPIDQEGELR